MVETEWLTKEWKTQTTGFGMLHSIRRLGVFALRVIGHEACDDAACTKRVWLIRWSVSTSLLEPLYHGDCTSIEEGQEAAENAVLDIIEPVASAFGFRRTTEVG